MPGADSARAAALHPGAPGYRAANVALFLTGLVAFALLYSPQALLPPLAHSFHLDAATVSLTVSFGTAGLTAGLPLWAAWSAQSGRRGTILLALFIAAALALMLPLSRSFPFLAALRLMQGMALAGVPATAMTYLGEEMAPSALGGAMGLYIAGNAIGGLTGRLSVGFAAVALGWRVALLILGLASVVLSLVVVRTLPPSRRFTPRRVPLGGALRALFALFPRRELWPLFAIGGLLMAAFVAVYNYIGFLLASAPYGLGLGASTLVYLFYLLGTLVSYLVGRAAARFGRQRTLAGSALLMLAGALWTLWTPLWLKLLGLGLFTTGFFGAHSTASTLVSLRAGPARGGASTLYLLTYYLGGSIGGYAIGLLWQRAQWPGVVLGTMLALSPAVLIAFWVAREREDAPAEST